MVLMVQTNTDMRGYFNELGKLEGETKVAFAKSGVQVVELLIK
jgi:hypothetical protein